MKFINLLTIFLILFFTMDTYSNRIVFTLDSPYSKKKYVFKGQLHSHSNRSDGKHHPSQVKEFYYKKGYNFLVLTEHNKLGRRFIPAVKHTSPYRNFIMIPGYEMFSEGNRRENFYRHHILGIGLLKMPEMKGAQYVINFINKNGGIPILCHPEWRGGFHFSFSTLMTLKGYHHIEKTRKWDYLLSKGLKVFTVFTDDFHSIRRRHFNKGFVMVYSNRLDQKSILKNLRKGNYYSSNGAFIKSIKVESNSITIEAAKKSYIAFYCYGGCTVKYKRNVNKLTYQIRGTEHYIRAKVRYKINGKYKYALTNPIFIRR